jgi:hypothetical protein
MDMLLDRWERQRLTKIEWQQKISSTGVHATKAIVVIEKFLAEIKEAVISVYLFTRYSGEPSSLVLCHDLGRGAISMGAFTQWGRWDEIYEVLTVDDTGEKFDFDGTPVSEGDDGACSLGNI